MGRGKKSLIEDNIDKRECGYYSTPHFIAEYIGKRMLEINPNGIKLLDPCCGKEELLREFFLNNKIIDGFDINKYTHEYKCNFKIQDFLKFYEKEKIQKPNKITQDYDYFIANPPYNCHEVDLIKLNKEKLKFLFKDVGIYNTYRDRKSVV